MTGKVKLDVDTRYLRSPLKQTTVLWDLRNNLELE